MTANNSPAELFQWPVELLRIIWSSKLRETGNPRLASVKLRRISVA
jgi:hypothetical protein